MTTTRGAIDGSGAFAFYIENTPIEFLTPGYSKYFCVVWIVCGRLSRTKMARSRP